MDQHHDAKVQQISSEQKEMSEKKHVRFEKKVHLMFLIYGYKEKYF
jgi:hypothetical protein